MMETWRNKFKKGGVSILGIGVLILSWPSMGHSGEWEPIIPEVMKGVIEIQIKNLEFTNSEEGLISDHLLVIPKGVEVRWVNVDPLITNTKETALMPHGIRVSDEAEEVVAESPILLSEGSNVFSYRFDEEGTYDYVCIIHPSLRGKIVVIGFADDPEL